MKKEKFIEKILIEVYDKVYFSFSNFTTEKMLIEKAMKYRNWSMFWYGVVVGLLVELILNLILR